MKKSWWTWGIVALLVLVIGGALFFLGRMSASGSASEKKKSDSKPAQKIEVQEPSQEEKELREIKVAASEGELKEATKASGGWVVRVEQKSEDVKPDDLFEQAAKFFQELSRTKVSVMETSWVAKTSSLKDVWGNTLKDVPLLNVVLTKDTFGKINWDGFEPKNLARVADELWLHDLVKQKIQEEKMKKEQQGGAGQSGGGQSGGGGGGGGG